MKHPTWFGRWRLYGWSCAGHVAQGAACGVLWASGLGLWPVAVVWLAGYLAYQALSFARKVSTEGRGDTAGLDAFDAVVGFVPAFLLARLATLWLW